ncbi:MAG: hypothetical protein Q7R89_00685 [bacterium]|nr:hypothetical protein [bacterium]
MPTIKKRLNITLSEEMDKDIQALAHRDNVPKATITAKLIREALELQEDLRLGHIAEQRSSDGSEYILNKDEFWK